MIIACFLPFFLSKCLLWLLSLFSFLFLQLNHLFQPNSFPCFAIALLSSKHLQHPVVEELSLIFILYEPFLDTIYVPLIVVLAFDVLIYAKRFSRKKFLRRILLRIVHRSEVFAIKQQDLLGILEVFANEACSVSEVKINLSLEYNNELLKRFPYSSFSFSSIIE